MHVNALHTVEATGFDREDGTAQLRRRLIRQADTCVACGMCLPVCPTYVDTREESESARGRISLIRALAEDRLTPTPALIGHLDRCLQCQACEAICPAGVHYGELIDGAHELLRARRATRPAPVSAERWHGFCAARADAVYWVGSSPPTEPAACAG